MKNLEPEIYRERLVVEGYYDVYLDEVFLEHFLKELGETIGMKLIAGPYIFSPDKFSELHHGLGGFVAWAESGAAFYSWNSHRFFTLDVYSCKPFHIDLVLAYVKDKLMCGQHAWSKIEYDS
ncbi:MAG: S-adenosylmethionine decarboxylase [Candidatus Bathyarchaeia archaeon]